MLDKKNLILPGSLVQNTRTNEIGLLLKDEVAPHFCEVLLQGKKTKWFKNNILELSSGQNKFITEYST